MCCFVDVIQDAREKVKLSFVSYKDRITRLIVASLLVVSGLVLAYFIFGIRKKTPTSVALHADATQSIAVLPFVNTDKDPGQDYLSTGLSGGIIDELAQIKGLKVTALASASKFQKMNVSLWEINSKLAVNTVLEGRYERQRDRIRIGVQLINAKAHLPIWSETYDEKLDNIVILLDRIARTVATKLQVLSLTTELSSSTSRRPPSSAEYELYQNGRSQWYVRTAPALLKGIDFFQAAIASYPEYAEAYAGLADCYTALGYASLLAPREAFPKAIEAAKRALQLDSTLAEPHASLGFCRFYYNWDWAEAEQEFRAALALNPNSELAYDWYGYYLTAMERYDDAITVLRKAAELDPLSASIQTDIGFSYYYGANYDNAMKELQASLQMNPGLNLTHLWLSRTHLATRRYEEAIQACKTALEITPDWPVGLAQLGYTYGVAGQEREAEEILNRMKSLSSRKFVTSYGMALLYATLNQNDQAFLMLDKAYEERSNWLVWLTTDPRWNSAFRADKRFSELVDRVGLPQLNK